MAQTKQATRRPHHVAYAIPGYKGYSSADIARKTDRIFSEDVLTRLSEITATVGRIKRLDRASFGPDMLSTLDTITDKAGRLARIVGDTVPVERTLIATLDNGLGMEMVVLDSAILEKVGNINQAVSMMDLESGNGITSGDLDSISELMDDVENLLRRRERLIAGTKA